MFTSYELVIRPTIMHSRTLLIARTAGLWHMWPYPMQRGMTIKRVGQRALARPNACSQARTCRQATHATYPRWDLVMWTLRPREVPKAFPHMLHTCSATLGTELASPPPSPPPMPPLLLLLARAAAGRDRLATVAPACLSPTPEPVAPS